MVRNKLHWDANDGTSKTKKLLPVQPDFSFVLKVPLRHFRPSVIYSVPYDQILQKGPIRPVALKGHGSIARPIPKMFLSE